MIFQVISWVCMAGFFLNTCLLIYTLDNYERADHATRSSFWALIIQLTGIFVNWYSAIHYNKDWYIKAFVVSVMIGSTVSFYNTYRFGMRKEKPGCLWKYITVIVCLIIFYCIFYS